MLYYLWYRKIICTLREFELSKHCGRHFVELQGRLLGLMAIGNQATDKIDEKIDRTAVAGVFDLRDVLQLVDNRLNNRPFA